MGLNLPSLIVNVCLILHAICHSVLGQHAIRFTDSTYSEPGSICVSQFGGPGRCKDVLECPWLHQKIRNEETSFYKVRCEQSRSGHYDLVCCPGGLAKTTNQPIDISPPDESGIDRCGYPYYDYGFGVRNEYPGNDTAEELIAQGFTINPLEFNLDHLIVFEFSNGTFTDIYNQSIYAYAPGGIDARRVVSVYMALIGDGAKWYCDGALINSRWVLTAAHCFETGDPITDTVVRLGEYNWADDSYSDTEYPLDFPIVEVVRHPEYKFPSSYHDLALVKLNKRPPQLRPDIQAVCLPWGNEAPRKHVGDTVTLTGWGATIYLGPNSPILQEVNVTVFDPAVCDASYSTLGDYKDKFPQGVKEETSLCAGDEEGGKDACQGDSGGPIVYLNEDNRYTLAGIVSTGYGCGLKEYPGIYVPINNPSYLTWIKSVAFLPAP